MNFAKVGSGAPTSWETSATADSLGRVTTDNFPKASGHAKATKRGQVLATKRGQVLSI